MLVPLRDSVTKTIAACSEYTDIRNTLQPGSTLR